MFIVHVSLLYLHVGLSHVVPSYRYVISSSQTRPPASISFSSRLVSSFVFRTYFVFVSAKCPSLGRGFIFTPPM